MRNPVKWVKNLIEPSNSFLYQPVLAFCSVGISDGDPFALCFEHLLPWIHNLMVSYPNQSESKEIKHAMPSRSFSRKSIVRIN